MKEMMVCIRLCLFSFLLIVLSSCDNPEPVADVKKEIKQKTISQETELTASVSEVVKISIPTVVCGTCEENIKSALENHKGIIESKIDIAKKTAAITFDPAITSSDRIRQVISEAGYDADNVKRNLNAYHNLDECCKLESNIHS